MTLSIILNDQLPSGKNLIRETFVKGRKVRFPNKRFEAWRASAETEIILQRQSWSPAIRKRLPLSEPMILAMSYREIIPVPANGTRDLTGMLDAIQHLLERSEIIKSDGLIKGALWSYPWRTSGPSAVVTLIEASPEVNGPVFDQCIQLLRIQTSVIDERRSHADRGSVTGNSHT